MFIGYYDLANLITLLGLSSAVGAMLLAGAGYFKLAVMALLFAGLTDMFDGRVARHANREDRKAKMFGIQIDSLADMVSFGVAPAVIAYHMGCNSWYDIVILIFYVICGAIRLAYFNTQAITETKDLNLKTFTGFPIPTICFVLPFMILMTVYISPSIMAWVFKAAYFAVGIAFVVKLKIKKTGIVASVIMIVLMLAVVIALLLSGNVQTFA